MQEASSKFLPVVIVPLVLLLSLGLHLGPRSQVRDELAVQQHLPRIRVHSLQSGSRVPESWSRGYISL